MCIGCEVEKIQGDTSRRDVNSDDFWLDMNFPVNFISKNNFLGFYNCDNRKRREFCYEYVARVI